MKTTRIMAVAVLIVASGLALYMAQAQQVGARRIDLQRHDLSVTGREVVQTIVELAPGTTAPRHTHPALLHLRAPSAAEKRVRARTRRKSRGT
jgi:quercetin dioxygenase-like cupin family protein